MKFAATTIASALYLASAPLGTTAFSTAFSRGVTNSVATKRSSVSINKSTSHSNGCPCPSCAHHPTNCHCASCVRVADCKCFLCSGGFVVLRMTSSDAAAVVEEESVAVVVPPEVAALDGVASDREAHNVERPARGSGIHKHHPPKDDDDDGRKHNRRAELKDLEIGREVSARVKSLASYGAFLDVGAKSDALLHVSRVSDEFVANVGDVLTPGQEITVRILSVDPEKNQIAVTMRSAEAEARAAERPAAAGGGRPTKRRERPQRSGGDQAAQASALSDLAERGYDDSQFVEGTVVSSLDFGAFVRFDTAQLGEGLEGEADGLVHISALAEGRTGSVSDVVSVGDRVMVRVRGIDLAAGRVSLSMISKEQEEGSRPASSPRERRGEGGNGGNNTAVSAVSGSWKNVGAADWKEQMDEFTKTQPAFSNDLVIIDRRK